MFPHGVRLSARLATLTLALSVATCRSPESVDATLLGDHPLLRVNGAPLPASMSYLGMRVTSGTLRFERGGATEYLNTCIGWPARCSAGYFIASGGWSVDGSNLTIYAGSGQPERHGVLTDTLITVYWNGEALVYSRQ